MINIVNWVAHISDDEKHLAYVGENEADTRQFLLSGDDAQTYRDWGFHLDVAFDLSTVTRTDTHRRETTQKSHQEKVTETEVTLDSLTTKETKDVVDVKVECVATADVVSLLKSDTEDGLLLTWLICRQHTMLPGKLQATLRAVSPDGQVKKSAIMVFDVDAAVEATPAATIPLSEFELMEQRLDALADEVVDAVATAEELVPQMESLQEIAGQIKKDAAAAESAAEKAETKVESLIERNGKRPVSLWVGTQAEYDAIAEKDETRLYLISDDETLDGYTNFLSGEVGLDGAPLPFGMACSLTDTKRIAALLTHKMALVRAAGQWVLCSVATAAGSSDLDKDDMVMISGCASGSYSDPGTLNPRHPELVVVDIRITVSRDPETEEPYCDIKNYSRHQVVGDAAAAGINVWCIDLFNAVKY